MAARSTAGLSKVSFHRSGICRYAVVSREPRPALVKWQRPAESEPGVTPLFDVIVPAFYRKNSFRDKLPSKEKHIEFVAAPDTNFKVLIRIFLLETSLGEEHLRKLARGKRVAFHGNVPLQSKTAWLTSYYDDLKMSEQQFIAKYVDTTKINMTPGSKIEDDFWAHMHIIETPTSVKFTPRIIDLQLGLANVDIPEG